MRSIISRLLPRVVSTVDFSSTYGCNSARQAMIDLHTREKTVEYTDNLMVYIHMNELWFNPGSIVMTRAVFN